MYLISTIKRLILQSQVIHPDWDVETHRDWLEDEGYDLTAIGEDADVFIRRTLAENVRDGRASAGLPQVDSECKWDGHAESVAEVGWCSVCQH